MSLAKTLGKTPTLGTGVVVWQVMLLLGTPTFLRRSAKHQDLPSPAIWFPCDTHPGRQQVMAPLPPVWETQLDFQVPDFIVTLLGYCRQLGNELADGGVSVY